MVCSVVKNLSQALFFSCFCLFCWLSGPCVPYVRRIIVRACLFLFCIHSSPLSALHASRARCGVVACGIVEHQHPVLAAGVLGWHEGVRRMGGDQDPTFVGLACAWVIPPHSDACRPEQAHVHGKGASLGGRVYHGIGALGISAGHHSVATFARHSTAWRTSCAVE